MSFPAAACHRLPAPTAAGLALPAPTTATLTSSPASSLLSSQLEDEGVGTGACAARPAPGGAEGADGAALGNYASNPSAGAAAAGEQGQDEVLAARLRRAERWSLLTSARKVTGLSRLRACRKVTVTGEGGPAMRHGHRRGAGYSGLSTCASVWVCPCCMARIAARRAEQLATVMAMVRMTGGTAYMVTFTVRHHRGHRLASVWDAVTAGWSAVTSGGQWQDDGSGLLGWARVVEATHTPANGWHLHVHALFCWAGEVDDAEAQRVAFRAWARWDRALRRKGFDSTPTRGVDARRVRFGGDGADDGIGEYFTKLAREVTAGYAKDSRSGRSPLAILRDAVETYRVEDLELWWEWEAGSYGRRQLTWSTGARDLRTLAGVREQTDEEIAMEEIGDEDEITFSREAWREVTRTGQESFLLDLAETGGMAAVTAWLDERGLGWSPARRAPRRDGPRPRSPQTRREARAVLGVEGQSWSTV